MATEKRTIMIDVAISTKGEATVDKQLDKVDDGLKDIKKSADKASTSMKAGFTASANAASLIPGPIGMAATAMNGLTGGIGKAVIAMKTMKGAIMATGIGALLIAVGSLIAYFTETERGAQKLRVIMAALGAATGAVKDVFIGLIESAGAFLSGDFARAGELASGAFKELGKSIQEDVGAAIELQNAMNAVKVATRELSVETAKQRAEIKALNLIAEDTTKSYKERGEAAKEAANIEADLMKQRTALAEENLRILKAQADLNESDEATLQAIAEAEIAVSTIRMESLELQTTLQNKLNTIEQQQETERQQRAAAEEARAAKRLADLQAEADLRFKLAEQGFKNEEQIEAYIADRKARTAEENLALDIERALQAEELKFQAVIAAMSQQQATIDEMEEARFLFEQEQMAIENELRYQYDQERLAQAQAVADEEARINKEKNDKIAAQEKELRDAKVGAARATAGALGQISALIEQQQGEATAASKAFAIAQVLIDTATSISSAIAGATEAATAGGPAAPFLLVTYIASMVGSVVGAIASATSILDSVPGGGSASGAVAGVASATSAPSVQPVTTNTTQLNNTEQAELMPVQAYVLETAITGSQGNVTQIESQATFGGG
jgi:hypothetical protein